MTTFLYSFLVVTLFFGFVSFCFYVCVCVCVCVPAFRNKQVGSVGGNRSECECLRDFYLPPGSVPGDKCIECPPNSICDGACRDLALTGA